MILDSFIVCTPCFGAELPSIPRARNAGYTCGISATWHDVLLNDSRKRKSLAQAHLLLGQKLHSHFSSSLAATTDILV